MLFVCAMLAMSLTGAAIAAWRGQEASVIAGLLTAYLVITALTTLWPRAAGSHWLDLGATLLALAVGAAGVTFGFDAVARGGVREGIPAPVLFMFGAVGLLAGASDVRMMRSEGLRGARRLARHLWRMCFALYIAAASFFLGQADEFPAAIRIPGLLAVPVLAPLLAMLYWLWRVRVRQVLPEVFSASARQATAAPDDASYRAL